MGHSDDVGCNKSKQSEMVLFALDNENDHCL